MAESDFCLSNLSHHRDRRSSLLISMEISKKDSRNIPKHSRRLLWQCFFTSFQSPRHRPSSSLPPHPFLKLSCRTKKDCCHGLGPVRFQIGFAPVFLCLSNLLQPVSRRDSGRAGGKRAGHCGDRTHIHRSLRAADGEKVSTGEEKRREETRRDEMSEGEGRRRGERRREEVLC
eukprot:746820-Hanusia_phi.AAC.7